MDVFLWLAGLIKTGMITSLICPTILPRSQWGGRPPKLVENMTEPVGYVVIHHTYLPGACLNRTACIKAMQGIQNYHMDDRGWNDIGYNFAVGGDQTVYAGRGWGVVGAHAPPYNRKSIGIVIIGDYRETLPAKATLRVARDLIRCGISMGKIRGNYQLIGHRQARQTECPGDALFNEIQTWPHFQPHPEP